MGGGGVGLGVWVWVWVWELEWVVSCAREDCWEANAETKLAAQTAAAPLTLWCPEWWDPMHPASPSAAVPCACRCAQAAEDASKALGDIQSLTELQAQAQDAQSAAVTAQVNSIQVRAAGPGAGCPECCGDGPGALN